MAEPEQALIITWVIGGPESNMPWLCALRLLSDEIDELPPVESPLNLLVVFHIPGSAYQPGFEGASVGRYTKSDRGLMVDVALPAVEQPEPQDYLYRQLTEAIMAAERWASRREGRAVVLTVLREQVRQLHGEPVWESLASSADAPMEGDDDVCLDVIVRLYGEGVMLLDRRHHVEALVDELLRRTGNGSCDGGDIGAEHANIFACVRDPAAATEQIVSMLEREGELEGAVVAVDNGEGFRVIWPEDSGVTIDDV